LTYRFPHDTGRMNGRHTCLCIFTMFLLYHALLLKHGVVDSTPRCR
jgi:hypothetical protein